jgi:hypothetical protein
MSAYNWRKGINRGANLIAANPQRIESKDRQRWACGRTVKRSLGDGRYDGVEVWTLKERQGGRAVVVRTSCTREQAERWCN